jgi:hypothetical protein
MKPSTVDKVQRIATVRPSSRRTWMATAGIACLLLTVVGVLSGVGVIGAFRWG